MIVRSVLGLLCAAVALTLVGLGARALRRRFMPALSGPPATLASMVLALGLVVGVAELLGTVGGFALLPFTAALCLVGAGTWACRPRSASSAVPTPEPTPAPERSRRLVNLWSAGAIVAVAVLAADWMTRVADSWHRGMTTADTLWYHLPVAARFVQNGSIYHLHYVDSESLTVFYPATSELLHGTGMLFLGNDFGSLLFNLAWLSLALFGAWCLGRRFGVAQLTLIGVAVVLATPELVLDDAGSALSDVVGLALFLAALALVCTAMRSGVEWNERRPELVCGAIAAGLAASTKYSMLVPVGALALGTFAVAPRGKRFWFSVLWTAVAMTAGGYWYLRNLVAVGNPIPQARLGIGPLHLPTIPYPGTSSIAHFLFQGKIWRQFFLPGMDQAFGSSWWVLFLVLGTGVVLSVIGRERVAWLLAFVGLSSFVAFIVTPQALGGSQFPFLFVVNARYAASALVVGVVLLPIALSRAQVWKLSGVLIVYLVVLLDSQLAPTMWRHATSIIAPRVVGRLPFVVGVVSAVVVVLACLLWRLARHRSWASSRSTVLIVVAITIVVSAGLFLSAERYYLQHRYKTGSEIAINDRLLEGDIAPVAFKWAQGLSHSRLALVNTFLQYPYYGQDLSNYVQYLSVRHENGATTQYASCRAWRQAVNDGRYRYVVVASPGFPLASGQIGAEERWTRTDPGVRLVLEDTLSGAHEWVYEVRRPLSPRLCPSAGSARR